jgi:hypothetical protein
LNIITRERALCALKNKARRRTLSLEGGVSWAVKRRAATAAGAAGGLGIAKNIRLAAQAPHPYRRSLVDGGRERTIAFVL